MFIWIDGRYRKKHTVVLKKTLYIRKNEMYISGKTKCIYFMQKRNVHKIKEK